MTFRNQPKMRANAKPAVAPGDGAPGSEYPALIKMSNQHTKRCQARAVELAQTKLYNQHSTHAVPVRSTVAAAAPYRSSLRACQEICAASLACAAPLPASMR